MARIRDQESSHIKNVYMRFIDILIWARQIILSGLIVSILAFIVVNFYLFASIVELTTYIYVFLLLSLLTDGLFILVQAVHRKVKHVDITCDPQKLTLVIACYNGADVIGETIRQAKKHVPAKKIIVVSDASTDNTVQVARKMGVQVIENETNLSKVFSINRAVESVKTPYVLILDDDVLIGDVIIPTSLLDAGYTAVAFNVMPVAEDSVINKLQVFEYRNSMQIGKNLRGKVGAIGNISGAIGLYRTKDLKKQTLLHSGQFAGEDEQRTILAHMYSEGKGITYTDQVVTTLAPRSVKSLFRQRAYSWSLAVPELIVLYARVLFSPKYHYLLKAEKAHSLYIYLTDPLRLLFFWTLVLRPKHLLVTYGFYLLFTVFIWIRTGAKDNLSTVLMYPLYQLWLTLCRFVGNFYWFKSKIQYFRKSFHKIATGRWLIAEYGTVAIIFMMLWGTALHHFVNDMKLYNQLSSYRVEEQLLDFEYEEVLESGQNSLNDLQIPYIANQPQEGTYIRISVEKGDTARAIAYKAVGSMIESRVDLPNLTYEQHMKATGLVLAELHNTGVHITQSGYALIDTTMLEGTISNISTDGNAI